MHLQSFHIQNSADLVETELIATRRLSGFLSTLLMPFVLGKEDGEEAPSIFDSDSEAKLPRIADLEDSDDSSLQIELDLIDLVDLEEYDDEMTVSGRPKESSSSR